MTGPVAVRLWGRLIGAVHQPSGADHATFQYAPDFARSGIQVAPLTMPLAVQPYAFPQLARASFSGLPGLLADSLPDYYGNALIDAWLVRQGRRPGDFNALERLCYVGRRGMGALEFEPATGPEAKGSSAVDVAALVDLAARVLEQRLRVAVDMPRGQEEEALASLLAVGTSAGGARAKALVAWNPETQEVRSGQVTDEPGFEHWILKFDGVGRPRESQLGDPLGYGAVEYAYFLMAREAGVQISESRLLEEGGRRHFMTRRFDRTSAGKLHMLSLGGMAHFDFNLAGAYAYEQALRVIRELDLPMESVEEQFRRMVFNILARNQDDHVKNIAFLMDKSGQWSLSPAFDLTYAFNPSGDWTSRHQMTVNGKRDGFTLDDLRAVARGASMKRGRAGAIYDQVRVAVLRWMDFAEAAGVDERRARQVQSVLRLELPRN